MKIIVRLIIITILSTGLSPVRAHAGPTIEPITNLSFGSFGIARNNTVRSITVTPSGNATYSARMVEGRIAPKAGEYALEGLPGDTILSITINDTTLNRIGGGSPPFALKNFTHNSPTTSPGGSATLNVGATLETTGSGANYYSGSYTGSMDLTIIY